jgi:hypothetical protein
MKQMITSIVLFLSLSGISLPGHTGPIFATASGNPLSSGLSLSDFFWPMHRFQITSRTRLHSVGGFFRNNTLGSKSIFGALVGLSGPADLPDSPDLSTADVLGTVLVDVGPDPADYSGRFNIVLGPGWYALAFGTGEFGADQVSVGALVMPSLINDLSPQLPFTAVQAGNPFGSPPRFVAQTASPRFFAAPEPGMLAIMAIGMAALGFAQRSRSTPFALRQGA